MSTHLLRTTVVGSYPQPEWLVNKELLRGQFVPRVKAGQLWRVDPEVREEALRDATETAIREMENAGLDIITDGEICRESYTNHFATTLAGLDCERPATILNRAGREVRVLRVVGPVRHQVPVELAWAQFLRARTRKLAKVTLPGPFTLTQQVKDEFYGDPPTLALEFAAALNVEARLLQDAGVDVIQFDEPWLPTISGRAFGVRALDRALEERRGLRFVLGYARVGPRPNSYGNWPSSASRRCRRYPPSNQPTST
jgi:5-methyltetrahydropteroyltriglutamate--homocysteine methyltransferase